MLCTSCFRPSWNTEWNCCNKPAINVHLRALLSCTNHRGNMHISSGYTDLFVHLWITFIILLKCCMNSHHFAFYVTRDMFDEIFQLYGMQRQPGNEDIKHIVHLCCCVYNYMSVSCKSYSHTILHFCALNVLHSQPNLYNPWRVHMNMSFISEYKAIKMPFKHLQCTKFFLCTDWHLNPVKPIFSIPARTLRVTEH